jgi:hypothetical protein
MAEEKEEEGRNVWYDESNKVWILDEGSGKRRLEKLRIEKMWKDLHRGLMIYGIVSITEDNFDVNLEKPRFRKINKANRKAGGNDAPAKIISARAIVYRMALDDNDNGALKRETWVAEKTNAKDNTDEGERPHPFDLSSLATFKVPEGSLYEYEYEQ